MARFEEYSRKYNTIRMERRDGILQMTFHTNGGTIVWDQVPHTEFPEAFTDIGNDPENMVVIMTGTGGAFISMPPITPSAGGMTAGQWDTVYWEGKHLLMKLLDIEVPVIAAVNGPAHRHSEIPLLGDIVLAAEEATFQDAPHFPNGLVAGDGVHVVYPLLMGFNRGRHFLWTGQVLSAREALDLGLVAEVVTQDQLLPRAWEVAREIAKRPRLAIRYTKVALSQYLKSIMHDQLGYGLALEGLAMMDSTRVER